MLKLLLKTRFLALADQFSGQSKGKRAISVRRIVLLAVAALLLLALAGYVVSLLLTPLYKTLLKSDLEWLYFALTGVGAFLISFMLTAFYAQGSIFEAKDNEKTGRVGQSVYLRMASGHGRSRQSDVGEHHGSLSGTTYLSGRQRMVQL